MSTCIDNFWAIIKQSRESTEISKKMVKNIYIPVNVRDILDY